MEQPPRALVPAPAPAVHRTVIHQAQPADLNAATCSITSTHGVVNSVTQAFRNNPNGYRPLYATAESQIHDTAQRGQGLLTAGEQSTRAMLAQVLGAVGVKKVTVDFS